MTGRGLLAAGILAAWGVGIAVYAQRELTRSPRAKMAEVAARVGPGATYFAVESDGRHVGFASNTIDTIPGALQVTDYLVADLSVHGVEQRTTAQSVVQLSRALALREFTISLSSDSLSTRTTGRMLGDSLLEMVVQLADRAADTSRVRVAGPLLLPTLVPLVVALGDPPEVGKRTHVNTFDPASRQLQSLSLRVTGESLFVVVDSAAFNASAKRWVGAHADSVRGFHVVADSGGHFDSWIDEQGRLIAVRATPALTMQRTAYEVAFENWRTQSTHRSASVASMEELSDASRTRSRPFGPAMPGWEPLVALQLRIRGVDLARFTANGGNQRVSGDTIAVRSDGPEALRPAFPLPPGTAERARFGRELRAEPLLEVDRAELIAQARRLRGRDSMADVVARRIATWVHDSIADGDAGVVASAFSTLRDRRGDARARALLFVALARAAGIPARAVRGVVAVDGRVATHTWAEVLLQHWVGADPTLGQFPIDASHARLLVGGVSLDPEITRLLEGVRIDVLSQTALPRDD